ncbi:MAG: CRISPR system precrRNA processing endoribonuclease RAMP protein Cas6 [Proteobacteria bacterium]|nr:CRISPR system precrRNA processing endoribonuclease RAMP protein Cas6 [Pseudomonadota bacterium]
MSRRANAASKTTPTASHCAPVTLHGDLAPFAELLHLGQWLHVGKNATMGLGGYRLMA